MKMRTSGRVQRIGRATMVFALAFFAGTAASASDVERRIPVIRDTADSGLTMEISREGNRQTAIPFLTLSNSTAQRIEDRIAKKTPGADVKEIASGTSREDPGRREATLSSVPPMPEEITIRTVKGFLKGLRSSRKEKPTPAVVAPPPELRLGRTDTSLRDIN